jgi:hypothetical protein
MPWSDDTHRAIARAGALVQAITDKIETALPQDLATTGEHGDWPLLGWALLAVAGRSARDVHALADSESAGSASTLARRLYEAVVTLAWVAIDPSEKAGRWLRSDRAQRIQIDDDLAKKGLPPFLEPEVREAFETVVASGKQMPDVAQRAEQADKHWSARTTLLTEASASERSLRFMYRVIYRGSAVPRTSPSPRSSRTSRSRTGKRGCTSARTSPPRPTCTSWLRSSAGSPTRSPGTRSG